MCGHLTRTRNDLPALKKSSVGITAGKLEKGKICYAPVLQEKNPQKEWEALLDRIDRQIGL